MRLLVAVVIAITLIAPSIALAAKANCSYSTCLRECTTHRGGTANGCSYWCRNAMTERQSAGQCPRR
jgi:hypothetical protein